MPYVRRASRSYRRVAQPSYRYCRPSTRVVRRVSRRSSTRRPVRARRPVRRVRRVR